MKTISLSTVPKQSLSVSLDNVNYNIAIRETNGVMSADIQRGDTYLCRGMRIVADQPIIPIGDKSVYGNFLFKSNDDELPYWTEFGSSQYLYWLNAKEWELIESGGFTESELLALMDDSDD